MNLFSYIYIFIQIHQNLLHQYNNMQIQNIIQQVQIKNPYFIAISGIPGAGKSTLALKLNSFLPHSVIIPMDGFHYYLNQLTQQGIKRRGAPFTFNRLKFKQKLEQLKQTKNSQFPSFDHAKKDPQQNKIIITSEIKYVIVQGLYLFFGDWELANLWDMKIWIECPFQIAVKRVASRHLTAKIQPTYELSLKRAVENDMQNAKQIIQKSDKTNCMIIKQDLK